jgi:predicted ATP-dependent endonuclease of OLD family
MKLKHLRIGDYRHLKDLDFDFTYQSGEKKGQTLEKICFIGQSATGKTSILELIKIQVFKQWFDKNKKEQLDSSKDWYSNQFDKLKSTTLTLDRQKEQSKLFIFPSELLSESNYQNFTKSISTSEVKGKQLMINLANNENEIYLAKHSLENYPTIDLHELDFWPEINKELIEYRAKFTQKITELFGNDVSNEAVSLLNDWKTKNPSPLDELSQKCLNPIFKKFNLEVDTKDTSSLVVLKPINKEKGVPANALSTGTKQILMTALPIFALPTEENIIMIDEPERSLYPDIQIGLMDYYQGLAPKAQFIIATHSPFIAAAFEPDERFILYFDNKGDVKVRRGSSPLGDDPNDMLVNDFGLQSIINRAGEEVWKEYLELKGKMLFEKDETKKNNLLDQVEKLEEEYNF